MSTKLKKKNGCFLNQACKREGNKNSEMIREGTPFKGGKWNVNQGEREGKRRK
jgi:hypothetical protein